MTVVDSELFHNSIGTIGTGTLASDPGSGGTTWTLTTGHGARFPAVAAGQRLRLQCEDEVVVVTAHTANADTMTVVRGQEGTTAAAHAAASAVNVVLTAAAARRYAPNYLEQPRHYGLALWGAPLLAITNVTTPTAGVRYYRRVFVPEDVTVDSLKLMVATAGSGAQLPANVFMAIYTSSGTRIAISNNMSTAVQSAGLVTSTSLTLDGGQSLDLVGGPDAYVWIGFVIGTQSTTAVVLRNTHGNTNSVFNANLTASSPLMGGTSGTAQTTMPTSFTPTSDLTSALVPWVGAG